MRRHKATQADFLIIGGGMAGATAAYALSRLGSALLLEAEAGLAYHATGRSAAFFAESYGGPAVQPLTAASKRFFLDPPPGFSEVALMARCGALHVVYQGAEARVAARRSNAVVEVDRKTALARAPMLDGDRVVGGLWDADCAALDVHALHQGFLRSARVSGLAVDTDAAVQAIERDGGLWRVATARGVHEAPILVNAAGAWADDIARLAGVAAVGIAPKRRTVITFAPGVKVDPRWPLVLDLDERWYFKPQGDQILASPADETPSPACDARPEEIDIARTVALVEAATRWSIPRISAKWAGLRSFAPDRAPVLGFDPKAPGFFWCAGQGGFGIQTAPAITMLVEALAAGKPLPPALADHGVDPARYAPDRF